MIDYQRGDSIEIELPDGKKSIWKIIRCLVDEDDDTNVMIEFEKQDNRNA